MNESINRMNQNPNQKSNQNSNHQNQIKSIQQNHYHLSIMNTSNEEEHKAQIAEYDARMKEMMGGRSVEEFTRELKNKRIEIDTTTGKVVPTAALVASRASMTDAERNEKPWNEFGWVPLMKSGKQKSPNMIRNQLQKYIDECKANGTHTQTAIVQSMGVNNNSFRRFMNPKTYKNQWSATSNSTYGAAARLLEEVQYDKDQAKKAVKERNKLVKKRKASGAISTVPPPLLLLPPPLLQKLQS